MTCTDAELREIAYRFHGVTPEEMSLKEWHQSYPPRSGQVGERHSFTDGPDGSEVFLARLERGPDGLWRLTEGSLEAVLQEASRPRGALAGRVKES